MEICIRCAKVKCAACGGKRCKVRSALPKSPWSQGVRHPGVWCDSCVELFVTKITLSGHKMASASLIFLKTIAQAPESYVREEPANSSPYATVDMLKKQRTKFMNKLAWDTFGIPGSPFAFDQVNYSSPFPYCTTNEIATVLDRIIDVDPDEFEDLSAH